MSLVTARSVSGVEIAASTFGGHVTSWIDADGIERLWMSELSSDPSAEDPGAPIRGGVPVLFPQFGTLGSGIKHGFARSSTWSVVRASSGGPVAEIELELEASDESRAVWPHEFRLNLTVRAVPGRLQVGLGVTNLGASAFEFTGGLHTYLATAGLGTNLVGMAGASAWEPATGERWTVKDLLWRSGEKRDVVLSDVVYALDLLDERGGVRVLGRGFPNRVVWNPGSGHGIGDVGEGSEANFVCVEPVAVSPINLQAGDSWCGVAVMEVL